MKAEVPFFLRRKKWSYASIRRQYTSFDLIRVYILFWPCRIPSFTEMWAPMSMFVHGIKSTWDMKDHWLTASLEHITRKAWRWIIGKCWACVGHILLCGIQIWSHKVFSQCSVGNPFVLNLHEIPSCDLNLKSRTKITHGCLRCQVKGKSWEEHSWPLISFYLASQYALWCVMLADQEENTSLKLANRQ